MSDQESVQADVLKQKKAAHDFIATGIQVLTTRVQYYHEEFEGIHQTVSFLRNMRDQIKKDIEQIEPPQEKEQTKPYVMDLTHVKTEKAD